MHISTSTRAEKQDGKWLFGPAASFFGSMLIEKVVGLTGFVIIHVFIASFSPAQGERNLIVNTKFTGPVNEMPKSKSD